MTWSEVVLSAVGDSGLGSLSEAPQAVGLLFVTGSSCALCKRFAPRLSSVQTELTPEKLRILVVPAPGSDPEATLAAYFPGAPASAVSVVKSEDLRKSLYDVFAVKTSPTLLVVGFGEDKNLRVFCRDGVKQVYKDAKGVDFPWRPKTIKQLLPAELTNSSGAVIPTESLTGKHVLLIFSEATCAKCNAIFPTLKRLYTELKKKDVEFVLVSGDDEEDSFTTYLKKAPWPAVPFAKIQERLNASIALDVTALPTLVTVEKGLQKIINRDAYHELLEDKEGERFPWYPKAAQALSEKTTAKVAGDFPSLVLLADDVKDDALYSKLLEQFSTVAAEEAKLRDESKDTEELDASPPNERYLGFFYIERSDPSSEKASLAKRFREMSKSFGISASAVFYDHKNKRFFHVSDSFETLSSLEGLRALVSKFKSKDLAWTYITV